MNELSATTAPIIRVNQSNTAQSTPFVQEEDKDPDSWEKRMDDKERDEKPVTFKDIKDWFRDNRKAINIIGAILLIFTVAIWATELKKEMNFMDYCEEIGAEYTYSMTCWDINEQGETVYWKRVIDNYQGEAYNRFMGTRDDEGTYQYQYAR